MDRAPLSNRGPPGMPRWMHRRSPSRAQGDHAPGIDTMPVALGLLALALGSLVYLTDRDGARAALIPTVSALAGSQWFGVLGLWLPSWAHAFAFSLFTASFLPWTSAWRQGGCLMWFAVDAAFELGQHPAIRQDLVPALERHLGPGPLGGLLSGYFVGGTFDRLDIAAAGIGALSAAVVLQMRLRQRAGVDAN